MSGMQLRVVALYAAIDPNSLVTSPLSQLELSLEGVSADRRHPPSFTKLADGRDTGITRGTPVRNWRQWSAVSVEELQQIAAALGISELDAALLGANIVFTGCSNFTQIPRGSTIWFPRPKGPILTVECENMPCIGPGESIAQVYASVKSTLFPKAAMHRRGLVGVVYAAGIIELGDEVQVRLPHG